MSNMKARLHLAMLHQSMPRNPPKKPDPKEKETTDTESDREEDSTSKDDTKSKDSGESSTIILSEEDGLTDYDVLFGRGTPFQNFPGNIRLRNVVAAHTDRYSKAKKEEKPGIAAEIVQVIKNEGGGRFLKRDKAQKSWIEVSDTDARIKVGHVLRRNIRDTNRSKALSHEAMSQQHQAMGIHEYSPQRVPSMPLSMPPGMERNPYGAYEAHAAHNRMSEHDAVLARMLAAQQNRMMPRGPNPMMQMPNDRHARLRRSMLLERELLLEREAMLEREMMLERRERLMRIQQLERELAVERELSMHPSLARHNGNAETR